MNEKIQTGVNARRGNRHTLLEKETDEQHAHALLSPSAERKKFDEDERVTLTRFHLSVTNRVFRAVDGRIESPIFAR